MDLPGVGPYTAGAVTSIAKNLPEPILDGNVIRVLTRVHALTGNPTSGPVKQQLWRVAREWVSAAQGLKPKASPSLIFAGSCSILNQALMELGATLCTPRSPGCPDCPVRDQCQAFRLGKPEAFPELPERTPITEVRRVVVLLEHTGTVAVRQRPIGGINGGLWEFPELDRPTPRDPAGDIAEAWCRVPSIRFESLPGISHSITRYRIHLEVVRARLRQRPGLPSTSASPRLHWTQLGDLADLPFTAAHRKIAARTYPQSAS
jgi:A/G-specific adenine glycosylase